MSDTTILVFGLAVFGMCLTATMVLLIGASEETSSDVVSSPRRNGHRKESLEERVSMPM